MTQKQKGIILLAVGIVIIMLAMSALDRHAQEKSKALQSATTTQQ